EKLLEVGVDLLEGGDQPLAAFAVQALDAAAQPVDGAHQIVAIGHQGGQARFLFGGFFLGAQIDAAKLFAFLLQALDTLLGLFQRRQFLAVLDLGPFGQFRRRAFQFVLDAGLQFFDALGGGFRQGLGAGAFLAGGRKRAIGALGFLVGFQQHTLGLLAGVAGLVARGFGRGDGVEKRAALLYDLFWHLLGGGQFGRQFFPAAGKLGDMLFGVGFARIPARLFLRDGAKTHAPGFAFAAQAFQGTARFAGMGARLGGLF